MARPRNAKAKAADKGKTADKPTSKRRSTRTRTSVAAPYDAPEVNKKPKKPKKAAKLKKMATNGVRKGAARRGRPKKDRWGEESVTTDSKSPLVNADLVKLFANPNSWACLDEDEKREILDLLPDHIRPEADPEDPNSVIPPPSHEFLRYNNNWRDGVRQYQVDLEHGRYDPEWLRQASQAMEERAAGSFDKWKEEQYEEFWGQKQKLIHGVIAGDSSTLKLMKMVDHNCVRVGDTWKFTRTFRFPPVIVEKEVKIIHSDKKSLTFAIPPGLRVFLCENYTDEAQPSEPTPHPSTEVSPGAESSDADIDSHGSNKSPNKSVNIELQYELSDYDSDLSELTPSPPSSRAASPYLPEPSTKAAQEMPGKRKRGTLTNKSSNIPDMEIGADSPKSEMQSATANLKVSGRDSETKEMTVATSRPKRTASGQNGALKDIIFKNVTSPQALCNKILAIDGRITDPPNGNAWKEIRCYRNNQDIGSLWEIRQELYERLNR